MPGRLCANFTRRRTLLLVLCNLLWASTYESARSQGDPRLGARHARRRRCGDVASIRRPAGTAARLGCRTWGTTSRCSRGTRRPRGRWAGASSVAVARRVCAAPRARHPGDVRPRRRGARGVRAARRRARARALRGGDPLVVGRLRARRRRVGRRAGRVRRPRALQQRLGRQRRPAVVPAPRRWRAPARRPAVARAPAQTRRPSRRRRRRRRGGRRGGDR